MFHLAVGVNREPDRNQRFKFHDELPRDEREDLGLVGVAVDVSRLRMAHTENERVSPGACVVDERHDPIAYEPFPSGIWHCDWPAAPAFTTVYGRLPSGNSESCGIG